MALTPLHFYRNADGPRYGGGSYKTDCGRFSLMKQAARDNLERQDCWLIALPGHSPFISQWGQWLRDVDLNNVPFPTRTAALEALESALETNELLDAVAPPEIDEEDDGEWLL